MRIDKLLKNDEYLHHRIERIIKIKLEEQKAAGKFFISDDEVDYLIKSILKDEGGYGCNLQIHLLWRLINLYGITLDKIIFNDYCLQLEVFLDLKCKLNKEGVGVISHYSSVDMEAELLQEFLYLKFNKNE